jgi:transcriptional regulator with GAF, ATPase, and Fis domain
MDDGDRFFRQFVLRICGSLNIGEALWNSFLYVREVMPADEIVLSVYDPARGSLDVVARADEKGFTTAVEPVPMPAGSRGELENVRQYSRVRIKNDVWLDPIIREVALRFKWPDCSVIVARLIIQHKFVGSLVLRANGKDRYSDEHGSRWALVNEPVAIALANSRQYQKLLKLKENLADDNRYLHGELRRSMAAHIVGADFGLKRVMEQVYRVAPLSSPVLLVGETGSGKEVIANAIHNLSPRSGAPLITVNCGAIPESLIDSELFGHEKGAFTGALTERRGRFERADKGTIFLDEVGELPPQAQVRLLRVLQEREIERVGGSHPIKVDIRIISATHRSLESLVREGTFRDDLYYRLRVYPITIPPIRERKADIPPLVDYFIEKKARELGFRSVPGLAPGAIDRLVAYDWPGNVREVANAVERALIQSDGKYLIFDDLAPPRDNPTASAPVPGQAPEQEGPLRLEEMEARHIRKVMEMTGGRIEGKSGAAAILGMNPATLRYRMQKLGVPFGRCIRKREPR